jgi:rubrerythrin
MNSEENRLVNVGRYYEEFEAQIARSHLESAGIESVLTGINFVNTYWLLANAEGGIKLKVRAEDAERARSELEKLKSYNQQVMAQAGDVFGEGQGFSEKADDLQVCPSCGSDDVGFERFSRWAIVIGLFLLRIPLPVLKKQWICNQCGHKWRKKQV